MPKLEVSAPDGEAADIERLVSITLRLEGRNLARISVSFADVGTMTRLNRTHRGLDRPTDVLSFPFDGDFPHGDGGEIVICREAADLSQPRIIDRLIVHGVLHLLGYEDDTDAQLAEMERRTDRVMERVDD